MAIHGEIWLKQFWANDRVLCDFDVRAPFDIVHDENYATFYAQANKRDIPPPGFTDVENPNLKFAEGRLQYQGGTLADRSAYVQQLSGEPQKYLVLQINDSYAIPSLGDERARIQMVCSNCVGIKHFAVRYKMRIPLDVHTALKNYNGELNWVSIFEIHNNAAWLGQGFDGSISAEINKSASPGSNLYFQCKGRDYDAQTSTFNYIWRHYGRRWVIPADEWFEVNIEVSEGDRETGRFRMWTVDAAGQPHFLYDVKNYTQNVYDPNPQGMADLNPIKWYTSQLMMNYMHDTLGIPLVAHFKDMQMLGSTLTPCHFDEL